MSPGTAASHGTSIIATTIAQPDFPSPVSIKNTSSISSHLRSLRVRPSSWLPSQTESGMCLFLLVLTRLFQWLDRLTVLVLGP